MPGEFQHDVFVNRSATAKATERPLAERLRLGEPKAPSEFGVRSADLGIAQPGMSAHAFGSYWAESPVAHSQPSTLDPQATGALLNEERRFIPLRLDDCNCPNGAAASSPRLAHRAYLGFANGTRNNPNGVVAWPRTGLTQPRWG